jgi:ABC-type Fe3+/spermidine/putrescine transport system ATPase subunit
VDGRNRVDVGVRPEKIRLLADGAATSAGMNVLTGRVRTSAYTGVSTQYQVELADGATVAVYEQNMERAANGSIHRPGEDVRLAWSPDDTFAVEPARSRSSSEVAVSDPLADDAA